MKIKSYLRHLLIPALALGLICGVPMVLAQPEVAPMDNLGVLNDFLQKAGAPALTSGQEDSIRTLIAEFRESHQSPPGNSSIQDARTAYENAILSGDVAEATVQAQIIGSVQAREMVQREIDIAAFAVGVIDVLKTGTGQIEALTAQMGTSRFVRLVLSLAGGPGGFGPRGRGPGPRGPAGPF